MSGSAEAAMSPGAIRNRIVEMRTVKAKDLVPDPDNPRTHPRAQKEAMRGLFDEIGWADTLKARELPDGRLMLVDGHMRAEMNPDENVPVLVLDVDEVEAKKLIATLDPIRNMAGVNEERLASILSGIKTSSPGLSTLLSKLAKMANTVPTQLNMDPETPHKVIDDALSRWNVSAGQLWSVGDSVVMCGDSSDPEHVALLLGDDRPSLVVTSPPYSDRRKYGDAASARISDWDSLMDSVFLNELLPDDAQLLVNLGATHSDGEVDTYWWDWLQRMRTVGWALYGWYVWDKGSGTFGANIGRLQTSHEWIFHLNKKVVQCNEWEPCMTANTPLSQTTGRNKDGVVPRSNMLGAKKPFRVPDSIIRTGRDIGSQHIDSVRSHPARFSVGFATYLVRSWDGIVYEPFAGSGTTIEAAHALGRKCLAMEIEAKYVAVILDRMSALGVEPKCLTKR